MRLYVGRALSASEVAVLYNQSRRGYPDAMQWLSTKAYFSTQGAATTGKGRILGSSILQSPIVGSLIVQGTGVVL